MKGNHVTKHKKISHLLKLVPHHLLLLGRGGEKEEGEGGRNYISFLFFFQNYVTVFTTAAARSAADSTAALIAPRATICALTFDMWSKGACVMWSQTHLLPAGNNTPPAEMLYTVATERWHCVAAHPPLPFRRSYNATSWSVAFN